MNMKGGAYIGEGTYGCTFDTPPKCKTREVATVTTKELPKKQIVKAFFRPESMMDEWRDVQILAKIDPNMNYFLYPTNMCMTTRKELEKDRDFAQCRLAQKNQQQNNIGLLKMPYGGITIENWVVKKRPSVATFLKAFLPVLQGSRVLQKHGKIHHDLKIDNILYDPAKQECRIIDFGLMIPHSNALTSQNPYLHSDYWLHPPEYRVASYIQRKGTHEPITDRDVAQIQTNNIELYQMRISGYSKLTLRQMMQNYLSETEYHEQLRKYILSLSTKKSVSTRIDVYSLGITLMYIGLFLSDIAQCPAFQTLVKGMLSANPRQRWSMQKVICHVSEIVASSTKSPKIGK